MPLLERKNIIEIYWDFQEKSASVKQVSAL